MPCEQNRPTIVAVIGCQRSGTTVLGQILGAHPRAVLCDEPDGVYQWFDTLVENGLWEEKLLHDLLKMAVSKYLHPEKRFARRQDDAIMLQPHVSHIILKVPNLTYSFQEVSMVDADIRVVSMVRDPRGVVASMGELARIPMVENQIRLIKGKPWLAAQLLEELASLESPTVPLHTKRALVWKIKTAMVDQFAELGLSCLKLKYEELVSSPSSTLSNLMHHVGLSILGEYTPEKIYVGVGPGKTQRSRQLDRNSLEVWRRQLTEVQQKEILQAASPVAEEHGYT